MDFAILAGLLLVVVGVGLGVTHVLTLNYTRQGESITKNVSIESSGEVNIDETVPASSNIVVACNIDVSALKSIYISSDQTVTLTTNDDGTPDDTLVITADKPLVWYTGCGLPNPFDSAVDVVTIKATRGSAGNAALKIRVVQDVSP